MQATRGTPELKVTALVLVILAAAVVVYLWVDHESPEDRNEARLDALMGEVADALPRRVVIERTAAGFECFATDEQPYIESRVDATDGWSSSDLLTALGRGLTDGAWSDGGEVPPYGRSLSRDGERAEVVYAREAGDHLVLRATFHCTDADS